jgi:hypothetical protein
MPEELLDSCSKQEISLPPPQYYELSRLITFDCIEQLANFGVQRNSTGSELWMPVRIKTSDGEVTLFPGTVSPCLMLSRLTFHYYVDVIFILRLYTSC